MVTIKADHHPLMRRMYKPKPGRAADQQDKRSIIPLMPEDWNQWLPDTAREARTLFKLPGPEVSVATA